MHHLCCSPKSPTVSCGIGRIKTVNKFSQFLFAKIGKPLLEKLTLPNHVTTGFVMNFIYDLPERIDIHFLGKRS